MSFLTTKIAQHDIVVTVAQHYFAANLSDIKNKLLLIFFAIINLNLILDWRSYVGPYISMPMQKEKCSTVPILDFSVVCALIV